MTTPSHNPLPPSLNDLMTRFLARKGTDGDPTVPGSEVEPHEAVGGFRAPTQTTWQEAMAVFSLAGVVPEKVACPPEWAALTARDSHVGLVMLAAGFYPQAVRNVSDIRFHDSPKGLSPAPGFAALRGWVRTALRSASPTRLLLASGIAASLGDWDDADAALDVAEAMCTGEWRTAWLAQKAAVLAARGHLDQAAGVLEQGGHHKIIALNHALVNLFRGQVEAGLQEIDPSCVVLPDSSGWRHLILLYTVIAKSYPN